MILNPSVLKLPIGSKWAHPAVSGWDDPLRGKALGFRMQTHDGVSLRGDVEGISVSGAGSEVANGLYLPVGVGAYQKADGGAAIHHHSGWWFLDLPGGGIYYSGPADSYEPWEGGGWSVGPNVAAPAPVMMRAMIPVSHRECTVVQGAGIGKVNARYYHQYTSPNGRVDYQEASSQVTLVWAKEGDYSAPADNRFYLTTYGGGDSWYRSNVVVSGDIRDVTEWSVWDKGTGDVPMTTVVLERQYAPQGVSVDAPGALAASFEDKVARVRFYDRAEGYVEGASGLGPTLRSVQGIPVLEFAGNEWLASDAVAEGVTCLSALLCPGAIGSYQQALVMGTGAGHAIRVGLSSEGWNVNGHLNGASFSLHGGGVEVGKWYVVSVTLSSSAACLYVDGSLVHEIAGDFSTGFSGSVFVGADAGAWIGSADFWSGKVISAIGGLTNDRLAIESHLFNLRPGLFSGLGLSSLFQAFEDKVQGTYEVIRVSNVPAGNLTLSGDYTETSPGLWENGKGAKFFFYDVDGRWLLSEYDQLFFAATSGEPVSTPPSALTEWEMNAGGPAPVLSNVTMPIYLPFNLFQDEAATVPATELGQRVLAWYDPFNMQVYSIPEWLSGAELIWVKGKPVLLFNNSRLDGDMPEHVAMWVVGARWSVNEPFGQLMPPTSFRGLVGGNQDGYVMYGSYRLNGVPSHTQAVTGECDVWTGVGYLHPSNKHLSIGHGTPAYEPLRGCLTGLMTRSADSAAMDVLARHLVCEKF